MNTLKSLLQTYATLVESRLDALVSQKDGLDRVLFDAARYSLLNGGKRIRPTLTLATAELFGAKLEALTPACAIEMIHTYSMIHDDLPCMDDDDFRRGKPSLHKHYNEALAVLTGDYLLTRAFQVTAETPDLSPDTRLALVKNMTQGAGGLGMIGGQVMDIISENQAIDIHTLKELHQKKTGSLIVSAITCGSLVGKASSAHTLYLEDYAQKIGLAFQIVDDVLDVTAGDKKRGPQKSSDIANRKSTYVSLLGLEKAKAEADRLLQSGVASLEKLPQNTDFLKELAHFIVKRDC